MKRLIVNADDFGYTRGVNAGIIRAFRKGIVTSTTIMANGEAFEDAADLARGNPDLGVGCHLVLVGGKAVAPAQHIASLVDSDGGLPATLPLLFSKLLIGSVRREEIAREFRAQIERVLAAGVQLTHLDSHKHTHSHPKVMEAVAQVAEEFGIRRIRTPFERIGTLLRPSLGDGIASCKQRAAALIAQPFAPQFLRIVRSHELRIPDHFWGVAATGRLSRRVILSMIVSMTDGTNELMCHPGQYDEELQSSPTRLKREREIELETLTDPAVRKAVEENDIRLIDFRGVN